MAKKEEVISLNETVEVIGTGKFDMQKDKRYQVHPVLAKKLIAKGAAISSK